MGGQTRIARRAIADVSVRIAQRAIARARQIEHSIIGYGERQSNMPKLIYYSTSGKWLEYTLEAHTTIGRHPDQDLQLLDRMISKQHAEINKIGEDYVLEDVGSRNGTLLNDEPVDEPVVLKDGDEISVGNHILRFSSPLPSSSSQPHHQDSTFSDSSSSSQPIRKRLSSSRFLPESEIKSDTDVREDYEKLRVAAELSEEASATFDVDALLNIIVDKAFKLFKADRAAILLRDENGMMQTKIATDRNRKPIKNFKISETLLDEVVGERNAVLSGDALQDNRFSSSTSILVDNIRSTMCVPLLYHSEVLGVINLDTQFMTGAFVEKDLQILTGFARQAAYCIQQNKLIEELRRNAVIKDNLRRIISPHLIDEVMSGKIELHKGGRRTEATVLFADIRGFSNMTELHEPEIIVNMLNDFIETMVSCVFEHEGALDKFVGDEVMAVWGVSVASPEHALSAVKCAIDMMKAVEALNAKRSAEYEEPITIGIGIASGLMIAGYMGSTQAMSYTVIGDTVNLASRLCDAAQAGEMLINEVNGNVDGRQLPPIMIKGKHDPVNVYRIQYR